MARTKTQPQPPFPRSAPTKAGHRIEASSTAEIQGARIPRRRQAQGLCGPHYRRRLRHRTSRGGAVCPGRCRCRNRVPSSRRVGRTDDQGCRRSRRAPGALDSRRRTESAFCTEAVQQTVDAFGRLDIVVNNAAYQQHQESIEDITDEQLDRTFAPNIYGYFYMTRAALPHLKPGSAIINTGSITGLEGSEKLLDYSATKGRDSRVYEIACPKPGRQEDSRELRLSGTGLDSVEPVGQDRQRKSPDVRSGHAYEKAGATRRDRAGLCVLRFERRLQLYHRRSAHAARW